MTQQHRHSLLDANRPHTRFLDAGMTNPSKRCGGRASKKRQGTKSRTYAGAEPRALWGFCRRFGLAEVGLKRSPRSACGEGRVACVGLNERSAGSATELVA